MDAELASFLASPVMIITGTSGDGNRPEIGRAVGASVDSVNQVVLLVLSAWQWPSTVANLKANGRVGVTFARPSDYVSYQIKGRATVGSVGAEELAISNRYMADIVEVLKGLGLDRRLVAPWLSNREPVLVRIEVDAVFVQTPGPKAGRQLSGRNG